MNIDFDKVQSNTYITEPGEYVVVAKTATQKEVTSKGVEKTIYELLLEDVASKGTIKLTFWTDADDLPKMKTFFSILDLPNEGTLNVDRLFEQSLNKEFKIRVERAKPKANILTETLVESKYVKVVYFSRV